MFLALISLSSSFLAQGIVLKGAVTGKFTAQTLVNFGAKPFRLVPLKSKNLIQFAGPRMHTICRLRKLVDRVREISML